MKETSILSTINIGPNDDDPAEGDRVMGIGPYDDEPPPAPPGEKHRRHQYLTTFSLSPLLLPAPQSTRLVGGARQ